MWDIETIQSGLTFGVIFSLCFIGIFFYIRNTTKLTVINTLISLIGEVEKDIGSGNGDIKKQIVLNKFYECLDKNLKGTKFYFITYFSKYFITQKILNSLIDEAVAGMRELLNERKDAIERANEAEDAATKIALENEALNYKQEKRDLETLKKIADSDK